MVGTDLDEDIATWRRTQKHERGHGNGHEDMETWTRGHGNMEEYVEIWTRTWEHGRGHGNMDEDMGT
jgi:hypothetical protein